MPCKAAALRSASFARGSATRRGAAALRGQRARSARPPSARGPAVQAAGCGPRRRGRELRGAVVLQARHLALRAPRGEAASSPPIALRRVRLAISASCAPTTSSVGRATSSSRTRGDMRRTPPRGSSNNGTWRLSARGRGSRGGRGDRGSGELLKSFSRRCSCRSSPSKSSRRNGGSPGALICTRRCLSMVRGPR